MSEKKVMFIVNILKNIINVYFDTFFVFYFFKVANYEVLPLAKYYLTLYLFCGIGFFLVRNAMKKNIKVPYFRIGISLQAIYIAMIMLLKDNIINYIYLVGFTKGIADGFFHFPKNILETEKISNSERQKFSGMVSTINKISAIIVPLILGVALTFMSYTDLGKIFFLLFIVMFIVSFYVNDDTYYEDRKMELKRFMNLLKENKKIRNSLIIPFLAGFTYSSGVMATIITLTKINIFKTNMNLGFVDSLCSVIFLITCIFYTAKMKKEKFRLATYISGICSFIVLIIFSVKPSLTILIIYFLVRNSFIGIINLISNNVNYNLSNSKEIKEEFKAEYYLVRDIMFCISRCLGYLVLLIVCLTLGMNYINYILVISAVSILIESIIAGHLCKCEFEGKGE